ncbi:hypothetical protein [Egibacter rhizosphaerae]|nr:hypothetical protein [Egibacter rhizosphaerae]
MRGGYLSAVPRTGAAHGSPGGEDDHAPREKPSEALVHERHAARTAEVT